MGQHATNTLKWNDLAAAVAFSLLCFALGCGSDKEAPSGESAKHSEGAAQVVAGKPAANNAAASPDPALSDEMRTEFGAASFVPADSAYFANSLRLGEQWAVVRNSNALRMLLELPTLKMALAELQHSEQWRRMERMRHQVPIAQDGFEVLADAFSREAFICLDQRWSDVLDALDRMYLEGVLGGMNGQGPPGVVDVLLDRKERLRIPGATLGFRLSDPKRAQKLLDALVVELKIVLPYPISVQKIHGGTYHVLLLDAGMIPPPTREGLREALMMFGASRIPELDRWIDSQTVAIAVGIRDDYLMISIGADTTQLEAFGAGLSLAESPAFGPIRRRFKPGVISLSYLTAELTSGKKMPVKDLVATLDRFLVQFGPLPDKLAPRLKKDIAALVTEISNGLPDARPQLAISFLNRGIETYSIRAASADTPDTTQPLPIFAAAGATPLLATAGRSQPSAEAYDRLVHWVGVAYSYFEDFVLSKMSKRQRAEFEKFGKTYLAAVRRLHATTKNELIPAIDATQSLFVLDGGGRIPGLPGMPPLSRPLRYPRPAYVQELNDAQKFTSAFSSYREIVNGFVSAMAKNGPGLRGFEIPPPESRPVEGGMLYGYAVPLPPEFGLYPHAIVTKDRAFVALAEDHSAVLRTAAGSPASAVVDFGAPAESVFFVDIAGGMEMLLDDADVLIDVLVSQRQIDPQTAGMIREHLPVAHHVLGVFKSYSSRTWIEGPHSVTHSWLRIEDAKR